MRGIAGGAAAVAVLVAACLGSPGAHEAPTRPSTAGTFPTGSFSKELREPDLGHVRLVWTFAPDGRWTEVPFALDGQAAPITPVRGTWSADGDRLTIATDWPPEWGTSTHQWRLDGDRLWTVLVGSDNPGDQDWFAEWDTQPWIPYS